MRGIQPTWGTGVPAHTRRSARAAPDAGERSTGIRLLPARPAAADPPCDQHAVARRDGPPWPHRRRRKAPYLRLKASKPGVPIVTRLVGHERPAL